MAEDKKHSIIAPSGASRWVKCPPSARMEEIEPDTAGEPADEGTLAHRLATYHLEKCNGENSSKEKIKELNAEYKDIKKSKYYSKEMEEYVNVYISHILSYFWYGKTEVTGTEAEFSLSFLCPEHEDLLPEPCTVDRYHLTVIDDTDNYRLDVIDLKYGFLKVEAKNNFQLMIYALAIIDELGPFYNITDVVLHIVQPRYGKGNEDVWYIELNELEEWRDKVLKPAAKDAIEGSGNFDTGVHCEYCKILGKCAEIGKRILNTNEVQHDPRTLTGDALSKILDLLPVFYKWCDAVKMESLNRVKNGNKIPGYKLVQGRRSRCIDPDKMEDLQETLTLCYDEVDWLKPRELKCMGDIEKLIGPKEMEKYIKLRDSSPVLVPESDKRKEIRTAASDFVNDEDVLDDIQF